MKHSPRLYYCALCHTQTVICSHCDRGQIYCSTQCSQTARLKSCREAEKRYQLTPGGKRKHAARQKHYRMRQKEKVTDQGSATPTRSALLHSVKNKTEDVDMSHDAMREACCMCKQPVPSWFRHGFLRYYGTQSTHHLSYFRPP